MAQNIKADKRIGKNIRRFRKAQGLTQEALVTKLQLAGCDLSRSTLAKIEAGIRHISVEEMESIRAVLEMRYADFFHL